MRHSVRQLITVALVVLGSLLGTTALLATPAAAATCSGAGCNYLDPDETGCAADARIIGSGVIQAEDSNNQRFGPVYGEAYLVESPACNTIWIAASRPTADASQELVAGIFASTCYRSDAGCNSRTYRSTTGTVVRSLMYSPAPSISFDGSCYGGYGKIDTDGIYDPAADLFVCV